MGILRGKRSSPPPSSTSPCADLRTAYHNCFNRSLSVSLSVEKLETNSGKKKSKKCPFYFLKKNHSKMSSFGRFFLFFKDGHAFFRWYAEKFVKGQWEKEECVAEWHKYRECLSVSFLSYLCHICLSL